MTVRCPDASLRAIVLELADVDCEVMLVQDNKISFLGLVVLVDKTYVLGYTYGQVDKKSALVNCNVLERYGSKDLL